MALVTLGTNAVTSLQALPYRGQGANTAQDRGNLIELIRNDLINSHPQVASAISSGTLFIPNRGYLQLKPGDYVGVDANGWPILVSAYSIATGGWTHT